MPENSYIFIWRCAKCTNHFASINQMNGVIKQEKKCPKCKSLNFLTLTEKEIFIHCKCFDPDNNNFYELEKSYPYPEVM